MTDRDKIELLADQIDKLLTGQDPATASGAVADCVARWIAGISIRDDYEATRAMREKVLDMLVNYIRGLIDLYAEELPDEP